LEEAIKLLEEKNIPTVLTENDFSNTYKKTKPDVDNLEGLILVHKTNYAPIDSRIKSTKEAKSYVEETHIIANQKIDTRIRRSRNTVHFSVNGEVSSHFNGDWEETKYAVLVPFTDISKEQIGSACSADTYTVGGVSLTPNCWILVPKGEKELVRKNNPQVNIIEYEGNTVTRYADQVIKMLGYSPQSIDKFNWHNSDSQEKYYNLMLKNNLSMSPHINSIHKYNETFETYMQIIVQVMQYIKEHIELLDNKEFLTSLTEFLKKYIRLFSGELSVKETIIDIQNYLLAESFVIPDENINKLFQSVETYQSLPKYITIEIINLLKKQKIKEKENINQKTK